MLGYWKNVILKRKMIILKNFTFAKNCERGESLGVLKIQFDAKYQKIGAPLWRHKKNSKKSQKLKQA